MSSLCSLLGYSRQAFYAAARHHQKQAYEAELILQQVLSHRVLQPRIGTRKLMVMMQAFAAAHRISLGRDGLFDLLREHGLLIGKQKRRAQTTWSKHWFRKYKNLIVGVEPSASNQLWVSDITYLVVADGFSYLSLITDGYSRKIVGFYLSRTLEASGSVKALQMALKECSDASRLIHHSDRGVQYCCTRYVDVLQDNRILISMTENSDPRENAVAERVNGILKQELLQDTYKDHQQAAKGVAKAIGVYNCIRPHSSCDMLTPQAAHHTTGPLKKHWKQYYKKKEVDMAAPG